MEGIQISVEKLGTQAALSAVSIRGYIDTTTAPDLERVLQGLLVQGGYKIVIDLKEVDYISSAGWGIFISEIKNIRQHGGDLVLANMSESVKEVFELLEFSSILTAVPTLQGALKFFGKEQRLQPKPSSKTEAPPAGKPRQTEAAKSVPPAAHAGKGQANQTGGPLPQRDPSTPAPSSRQASERTADADQPQNENSGSQSAPDMLLIDRIIEVVRDHPAWGAWNIKEHLNKHRGGAEKISWGALTRELQRHQLASKEDRIRLARRLQSGKE
jgi:anti-sigma B factor antagonist